jgi:hypothetical protein
LNQRGIVIARVHILHQRAGGIALAQPQQQSGAQAANSVGAMPSGASSREASARRSRMCPQRDTICPPLPASTARTSAGF